MKINTSIWGNQNTWINAGGPIGYTDEFKRAQYVYTDVVYNNNLTFNDYEQSTARWGLPGKCSAGHFTTFSWYWSNGFVPQKKEPIIDTNVPCTVVINRSNSTYYFESNNTRSYSTYQDSVMHYPPYDQQNIDLATEETTISWTNGTAQPVTKQITTSDYASTYSTVISYQCLKYNYNKNVINIRASWCRKNNLNYLPTANCGDLSQVINTMRSQYQSRIDIDQPTDYLIFGASAAVYTQSGSTRSLRSSIYGTLYSTPAYQPSERWSYIRYSGNADARRCADNNYILGIGASNANNIDFGWYPNSTDFPKQYTFFKNATTPYSGSNVMKSCDVCCKASSTKQIFDDVAYHWAFGIVLNGIFYPFDDPNLPTSISSSYATVVMLPYIVIDGIGSSTDYFDALKAAVMHEFAFYGVPFTIAASDAVNAAWDDNTTSIFLPVFDDHLITTGKFKTLSAAYDANQNNANWDDIFSGIEEIDNYDTQYQPGDDGNPQDYGDLSNMRLDRQATSTLNQFVVSANQVLQIQSFLNGTYLPENPAFIADFKGTNPQNYIVSLQCYPYNLPCTQNDYPIYIGSVNTYFSAKKLYTDNLIYTINDDCIYDFGTIDLQPYFFDFRDYKSKIVLQMPFVGAVDLDTNVYMGTKVGLKYNVDYDTGSVCAEISRNGLLIETHTSKISVTVPFFAADMGQYQNALASIQFGLTATKIQQIGSMLSFGSSAASSIVSQNPLSVITSGVSAATTAAAQLNKQDALDYQLDHIKPQSSSISTASPGNAFFMDPRARLLIYRPKMLLNFNPAAYGHTVGYACSISGKIKNFAGFTVIGSCDLSGIPATAAEKNMIKSFLNSGIII